ncbi:DUF488 domain-containing protein [Oceanobacillus sp. CAU 1775]
MDIYTIGHSTHSKEAFLQMLQQEDIEVLADVRAFPASRKFPQFHQKNFEVWLAEADIQYEHFPLLGGRRRKSQEIQEELNSQWNNPSFHNYADYTLTADFENGIKNLKRIASKKKTAICCSERHPSRCHRLLISNWLTAKDWNVYHIINQGEEIITSVHELGEWGAMPILEEDGTVVYPDI